MTSAHNAVIHSISKIAQTEVIQSPFPHMEVDNIFPESYYQILLARIPDLSYFSSENENVLRLDLVADLAGGGKWNHFYDGQKFEDKIINFWLDFVEHYMGETFVELILTKFETFPEENVYMTGRICVDRKGSGLGPHADRFDKIVSVLYHIPRSLIHGNISGTKLFTPKDPNLIATDEHYTFEEFNEVKNLTYSPNKLVLFETFRNRNGISSWHGFRHDDIGDRASIKTFIQRDLPVEEIRAEINKTRHRSRRWRDRDGS